MGPPIIVDAQRAQKEALNRHIDWREYEKHLKRLSEEAKQIQSEPKRLLIRTFTLVRGGWHDVPLVEMNPLTSSWLLEDLLDKPDTEIKKTLDVEIPAYFRKNGHEALEDTVGRWNLYPGWRCKVFEEALWAHKNEKYALSVSALAPQIEGMLRQETNDYEQGTGWIRKINETLDYEYDKGNPDKDRPPKPAPTEVDLEEAVEELLTQDLPERYQKAERVLLEHTLFRVNELYNQVDFSDPGFVNATNRHAILYGVSEDFGEVESTKLFCAVELVHKIISAYRETSASGEST